jgi:hypothetical protein
VTLDVFVDYRNMEVPYFNGTPAIYVIEADYIIDFCKKNFNSSTCNKLDSFFNNMTPNFVVKEVEKGYPMNFSYGDMQKAISSLDTCTRAENTCNEVKKVVGEQNVKIDQMASETSEVKVQINETHKNEKTQVGQGYWQIFLTAMTLLAIAFFLVMMAVKRKKNEEREFKIFG